jgi:membrane-bound ClpP family serine protease
MGSCCYNSTVTMKTRVIVVTLVTNILYEAAIFWGFLWLLPRFGLGVPLWSTILVAVIFAGWAAFCFYIGMRTIQKKPLNGFTSMVGMEGIAKGRLDPGGYIQIDGALWAAESEKGSIETGSRVEVVAQKVLKLVVKPK